MIGIDGLPMQRHMRLANLARNPVRRHTDNNAPHFNAGHTLGSIHGGAQTVFGGAHVGNLSGLQAFRYLMSEAGDTHHPVGRIVFGGFGNQTGHFVGTNIKRGNGSAAH